MIHRLELCRLQVVVGILTRAYALDRHECPVVLQNLLSVCELVLEEDALRLGTSCLEPGPACLDTLVVWNVRLGIT